MLHVVFKCSAIGANVQHWLNDGVQVADDEYEAITGPACGGVRFLSRKTGKLFDRESDQSRRRSRPSVRVDAAT
jgi:hypothetical protein